MVRVVGRGEVAAFVGAAAALFVGWRVLRYAVERSNPRFAIVRQIRREADPRHDLVVIPDEAPEVVDALAPVPAVWGAAPLHELTGFRRLYVLAQTDGQLGPIEARLGTPTASLGIGARRWDVDGVGNVVWDLADRLLDGVQAHRDGGIANGACPHQGNMLHCTGREDWTNIRVDTRSMGGMPLRCVWAHPTDQSRLVLRVPSLPAARFLVGTVGIDDHAPYAGGPPVENRVHFAPVPPGPPVDVTLEAPNRIGVTPFRIALGGRAGELTFTISTANAGARQFCFNASATN